jgi:putative hydrolase
MAERPFGFGVPGGQGRDSGSSGGSGEGSGGGDRDQGGTGHGQGGTGQGHGGAGQGGAGQGSGSPGGFGFSGPAAGGGAGRGGGPGGGGAGGSGPGGSGPAGGGGLGPFGPLGDPQQFADALRQFADLMSWQGGPVNWDLAKNVARHAVAAEGDPSVLETDRHKISDAVRLADLWLDAATDFPTGVRQAQAWSRSEWVEATLPVWSKLCDPIADKAVDAMGGILAEQPGDLASGMPEELGQALKAISGGLSGLGGMLRRIGGMMVGSQTGAAVGALAREVVSSTDVGLPLGPEGTAALLPAGVAGFGEGLSVDADEVRLFLALREAAHHRLFAHVPWLRARLLGAVEDYARGITVDASRLRDAMPQIDPANPEALREALAGAELFQPEDTPQQKAALARLETALALVEGWVATVVDEAAGTRLPQAGALAEAIRRRRATGGPAERTFATLVGLQMRPRKLREAAVIWRKLTEARGIAGRDAIWSHPDLLPTAEDFDDPDGFVAGRPELDTTELDEAGGPGSPGGPGDAEGRDPGDTASPGDEGRSPGKPGSPGDAESRDPGNPGGPDSTAGPGD